MAIDLYYAFMSSPCRAVLLTAKHLNIDIKLINFNLRTGDNKTPEFTKLNPAQKVPVINDKGFVLRESRAIMQYLCDEYDPNCTLYPKDVKKRAIIDQFLNFSMTYHTALREALGMKVVRRIEPTEQQITTYKNTIKLFNTLIGDNKYVAGNELTIADLSLITTSTIMSINDFQDIQDLPNLKGWYERVTKELPYFDEVSGSVPAQYKRLMQQK